MRGSPGIYKEAVQVERDVIALTDGRKLFQLRLAVEGSVFRKGRLLGIQFDTLFTDRLYFEISRHAIEMAELCLFLEAELSEGHRYLVCGYAKAGGGYVYFELSPYSAVSALLSAGLAANTSLFIGIREHVIAFYYFVQNYNTK